MTLYVNTAGEIRDIPDGLVAAWGKANNPKAAEWSKLPARPADDAQWIGGEWITPAPAIPESVSPRQLRLWMLKNGISAAQVDAALDAIPDDAEREAAKIEWEFSPWYERRHPMLQFIAAGLGLSAERLDDAFREASLI